MQSIGYALVLVANSFLKKSNSGTVPSYYREVTSTFNEQFKNQTETQEKNPLSISYKKIINSRRSKLKLDSSSVMQLATYIIQNCREYCIFCNGVVS